ncbi:hypothetical protein Ancab_040496 [Ancistrocladus abbreviatus]
MESANSFNTQQNGVDSSHHHLHLHHSDSPSIQLVSKTLDGDNYAHWSRAVTVALSAKKKLGFVLGTCKRPEDDLVLQDLWDTCNDMVISWLLNAVKPEIAESVMYATTAKAIWTELKHRYGQPSGAKLYQLQRELCSATQGNRSVAAYFTHMKRLWDEYNSMVSIPSCTCGSSVAQDKIHQTQQLMQFLMGLNEAYTAVRGNLLLMKPLPTVSQAYSLLLEEERQRGTSNPASISNDSASFVANNQKYFPAKINAVNNIKKTDLFCTYCKMRGHTIEKCYRLHGYPPGHKFYKGKIISGQVLANAISNGTDSEKGQIGSSFTPDQYTQLVAIFNKLNGETQKVNIATTDPDICSGPFHEEATGSW